MAKMWDGRFGKETDASVDGFNSSIGFDRRLFRQDVRGSVAHVRMLAKVGVLPAADAAAIEAGLQAILADLESGALAFDPGAEDVHMFVEAELTRRIGEAGKRLHTGRSRNDQVALDLRLWLKDELGGIRAQLAELVAVLARMAREHLDTVMPGYTHLQRAQPITFAHHLGAYVAMLRRDHGRLGDCVARLDLSPLGSGALAGTVYPLDRAAVAQDLGLAGVTANSLDGVSDRDFAIEAAAALSIVMVHLSRFSEEIVLWSSQEFGFVELDDAYSTGSSIMPQKKNPDVAELARGKAGRVFGDLVALLTVMKGLPLAYNKDMQEDKEAVFDAVDTVKAVLVPFTGMLASLTVKREAMRRAAAGGFTNATDFADYLVGKGLPFRSAHEASGKAVKYCLAAGTSLEDLSLDEFRTFSPLVGPDVYEAISLARCVDGRSLAGGPAPAAVAAMLDETERWLAAL